MESFKNFFSRLGFLTEGYDPEKTWDVHKDAIAKRANEGGTYVSTDLVHKNVGDGMNARLNDAELEHFKQQDHPEQMKILATKMGAQSYTPQLDHPAKVVYGPRFYNDTHLAASYFQAAKKYAGVDQHMSGGSYEGGKAKFQSMVNDASPHAKYAPTITKMYATGGIKKMEDIETQAKEVFGKYHRLAAANKLDPKLNTHGVEKDKDGKWKPGFDPSTEFGETKGPSHTDFRAMHMLDQVRRVVDHAAYKPFFAGDERAKGKNFTVVHDDDDVTVYHPHDHDAAKGLAFDPHTGQKAAWCTAADSHQGKGYFDNYSKQGPLLIYHPKNPLHAGEMYQTHHGSDQFMDEHDEPIDYHHGSSEVRRLGITYTKMEPDENGDHDWSKRARFKNFNSQSALKYSYGHMYDHPEKYSPEAGKEHDDWVESKTGRTPVQPPHGDSFHQYLRSRDPGNSNGSHWRDVTSDEAKASREAAEKKGHTYFPANRMVANMDAYGKARQHHFKVDDHYYKEPEDEDDEEDDDRWRD